LLAFLLEPPLTRLILLCFVCAIACQDRRGSDFAVSSAAFVTSAGSLDCTPSPSQTDACSGKTAGQSCGAFFAGRGSGFDGICRTTLDGAGLACAPGQLPPRHAVNACAGKSAGDACQPDDHFPAGVCVENDSTLACALVRAPPDFAVAACSTLAAGDDCSLPRHFRDGSDAGSFPGVCETDPTSADGGTVVCEPLSRQQEACVGVAIGAACTLGNAAGTCEAPAAGGDAACVVSCSDVLFGDDRGFPGHPTPDAGAPDAGN
jgi:hypothetical protein